VPVLPNTVLDLIERTVKRGDRAIDLLPREFRLLEYMMRRKEQILSRSRACSAPRVVASSAISRACRAT
jgi:DNA-binding response OmpR family regulator